MYFIAMYETVQILHFFAPYLSAARQSEWAGDVSALTHRQMRAGVLTGAKDLFRTLKWQLIRQVN
jgi:hypothetical protein